VVCPDASLAIKWVVDGEENQEQARALYRDARGVDEAVIAPGLLTMDVSNILRQSVRRSLLLSDAAVGLLDRFLAFPIEYRNPDWLSRRALALANAYNLPATYDSHYLALAQHYGCEFWTGDRRLVNALGGRLPFVRWLGDYAA
jgi:predicted nucleic acid-binding protein